MRKIHYALLAALMAASPALLAVKSEWIAQHSFEDFVGGEARQVQVSRDGFVRLGPSVTKLAVLKEPAVWDAVADGAGGFYVAAGNEGKVYRVGASGDAKVFFQSKEINVYALAVDGDGNLYAGSSPDGKIYRVAKDGKSEVWFEPRQKYIWTLQFDGEGRLFAGTGEKGVLYRITGRNQGGVFYDSDEKHIRSLLLDSKSRLWAGSDPGGIVFRFAGTGARSANPSVLYDSKFREVKSFAEDETGCVYAAIMGDGQAKPVHGMKGGGALSLMKGASKDGGGEDAVAESLEIAGKSDLDGGAPDSGPQGEGSELIRINDSDEAEFWGSDSDGIFALAPAGGDRIWAGTSDHAKFYEASGRREFTLLGQLEAREVVRILSPAKKDAPAIFASSHPAALWKVSRSASRSGTFTSSALDARFFSRWGAIESVGETAGMTWSTRSGNTAEPDKTWSEWREAGEGRIPSPPARYLQYRFELASEKNVVDEVRVFFLPFNARPVIASIQINQPGIELTKITRPELPPMIGMGVVAPKSAKNGSAEAGMDNLGALMGAGAGGMMPVRRAGWRSANWQAKDPNNDPLSYDVLYRTTGETAWKPLERNLKESFISWDAAAWLDGEYVLKVVVSDAPGNPAGQQKIDSMISDVFLVDNSSPVLEGKADGNEARFTARDAGSVLKYAEISIDGDDWRPVLSDDGIIDKKQETFTFSIKDLKPGAHYIVLRVKDQAENEASTTLKFSRR